MFGQQETVKFLVESCGITINGYPEGQSPVALAERFSKFVPHYRVKEVARLLSDAELLGKGRHAMQRVLRAQEIPVFKLPVIQTINSLSPETRLLQLRRGVMMGRLSLEDYQARVIQEGLEAQAKRMTLPQAPQALSASLPTIDEDAESSIQSPFSQFCADHPDVSKEDARAMWQAMQG
ncbi:MAG: hypothetical protein O3A01_02850 [bacterium]|nr:hypothetical protein [bacterium]